MLVLDMDDTLLTDDHRISDLNKKYADLLEALNLLISLLNLDSISNGLIAYFPFDGNIEAMAGDVIFDTELQRTINVDIRYVLWLIDEFSGAKHIVDEMTIVE